MQLRSNCETQTIRRNAMSKVMEHITNNQLASYLPVRAQFEYWNNLVDIPVITMVEALPIADLRLAGFTIQAGK